jgi:H+/Na+-translocating ferredoxin:NAD+ oxidoreductase subunit A
MSSLLIILLSTVLINVLALTVDPRWRAFVATSAFEGARATALTCLVLVPVVTTLTWLLSHRLLEPLSLAYLRTPAFVAVVLMIVSLAETLLRRYTSLVPAQPGFAVLMTTNATLLGLALVASVRSYTAFGALLFSAAGALLLGALLLAYSSWHERARAMDIPPAFHGAPLALISAGIVALAFMGFTGLIQE